MNGGATEQYEAVINDDLWPLQVVQNIFAYGGNLPLRMLDFDTLENMVMMLDEPIFKPIRDLMPSGCSPSEYLATLVAASDVLEVNTGLSHNGSLPSEHKPMPTCLFLDGDNSAEFKHAVAQLEKRIWITNSSNEFLMVSEFRNASSWRLWELIWLHYHITALPQAEASLRLDHVSGIPNLTLVTQTLSNSRKVLVGGPILTPGKRFTGGEIYQKRVMPAIKRYREFIGKGNARESDDSIYMAAQFQLPQTASIMNKRLMMTLRSFDRLFKLELPVQRRSLRQCDHISLAQWMMLFTGWEDSNQFNQKFSSLNKTIFFRFDHALGGPPETIKESNDVPRSGDNWIAFRANSKSDRLIVGLEHPTDEKYNFSTNMFVATERAWLGNSASCCGFLNELEDDFMEFSSQIHSKQKAHSTEWLTLTREQFNSLSGVLEGLSRKNISGIDSPNGKYQSIQQRDAILEKLCENVSQVLASETAKIFRYDHASGHLRQLHFHFEDPDMNEYAKAEGNAVYKAGGVDSELRKASVCYRAIDQKRLQFTRCFDPNTGASDPEGERMLDAPAGLPSFQSAIAAPIMVFGVPWGVLEVNGKRPYQFRWSDCGLINQAVHALSRFLYYQELLRDLHEINQSLIGVPNREQDPLNQVCHYLSRIFMSQGASLWVRHPFEHVKFICRGVCSRPEIEAAIQGGPEDVWFTKGEEGSISAKVLNAKTIWHQEHVGKKQLSSLWQKDIAISVEEDITVDHLTVIRIQSAGQDRETHPIATLSLYNQNSVDTHYSEEWQDLIEFIAGHVALLLDSIDAQENRERTQRRYIEHEIKQRVRIVASRADAIAQIIYGAKSSADLFNNFRFKLILKDLDIYARSVQHTIAMLSEQEFTLALRYGKNPVILNAEKIYKKKHATEIDLSRRFQMALAPFFSKMDGGIVRPDGKSLPQAELTDNEDLRRYSLIMHGENLQSILDNLLNNAMKYADVEVGVDATFTKLRKGAQLTIRNMAPAMKLAEKYRVTEDGFRSEWARKLSKGKRNPSDGEGKGLFIVKAVCELYNIEFSYDYEKASGETVWWHIPTLIFPEDMVFDKYNLWRPTDRKIENEEKYS